MSPRRKPTNVDQRAQEKGIWTAVEQAGRAARMAQQVAKLAAMEADEDEDETYFSFARAAPMVAPTADRPNSTIPLVDLRGMSKIIGISGLGGSGKTMLARCICDEVLERNVPIIASALDPESRTLTQFFDPGFIGEPESRHPDDITEYFRIKVLDRLIKHPGTNAIVDFGGGDQALAQTTVQTPGFVETLEQAGIAYVAAYTLTPRLSSLGVMEGLGTAGFRPTATMLILNMAMARSTNAFKALHNNPVYKAEMENGAVEIQMPKLAERIAQQIENRGLLFSTATNYEKFSPLDRETIRAWLQQVKEELTDVVAAGWMPWT